MTEYHVHRAQEVGDQTIDPATIVIKQPFPHFQTLRAGEIQHQRNAEKLADILCRTLPGGTLNRLTAELLKRAAGALVVASKAPEDPTHDAYALGLKDAWSDLQRENGMERLRERMRDEGCEPCA